MQLKIFLCQRAMQLKRLKTRRFHVANQNIGIFSFLRLIIESVVEVGDCMTDGQIKKVYVSSIYK